MRRFLKNPGRLLLLAVCFLLFGTAWTEGRKLFSYECNVEMRYYSGDGVPQSSWEQLVRSELRENPELFAEAAAWNVERGVEVFGEGLPWSQKVVCMTVVGDKGQVLKRQLLTGNFGYKEDTDGCVVSSSTAFALFKSLDVAGQKVRCKGKLWTIRGVVKSDWPLVMTAAGQQEDRTYSNLSFAWPDADQTAKKTRELLFQYGITQEGVLWDGSFFASVCRLLLTVPGWCLLFGLLRFPGVRRHPVFKYALLFIGAAFLIYVGFHFPEDFIPGKWSDFGFWVRKYREISQNAIGILEVEKTVWDVERMFSLAVSGICSAGAGGILLFLLHTGQRSISDKMVDVPVFPQKV